MEHDDRAGRDRRACAWHLHLARRRRADLTRAWARVSVSRFDAAAMGLLYDHITAIISNKEQWKKMGSVSEKIIVSYSFKNIVSAIENYPDKK